MTAFISGIIFGVIFMGCVIIVYMTRSRKPKREIEIWSEDAYQPPPVKTTIVNRHRSIEL